ncbi:41975_t:CDS:2 [Gigaspora margarita]|uniref:41975_t:CDS:1 n=1 Tax=Gigaspora margarita TaxID=4874 RepID=A0ABN7UA89_GIGMA|nr:41975_t:CDS:2 [Gigaspora margarita]
MSENIFSYMAGETRVFGTSHDNIQVNIEGLNEDVTRVILVDKNESPINTTEKVEFINKATKNGISPVEVKGQKSYLITWINSYELCIAYATITNLSSSLELLQGMVSSTVEVIQNYNYQFP